MDMIIRIGGTIIVIIGVIVITYIFNSINDKIWKKDKLIE